MVALKKGTFFKKKGVLSALGDGHIAIMENPWLLLSVIGNKYKKCDVYKNSSAYRYITQ